ncbi:MAG: hypothetical protein RRE78_11210 [Acidianus sp.]|nr:hypothetical protein [Acidianus sp.]
MKILSKVDLEVSISLNLYIICSISKNNHLPFFFIFFLERIEIINPSKNAKSKITIVAMI